MHGAEAWTRPSEHPLCPPQLMAFQLVERRAPPPPPRLGNKHLFLQKNKKGEVTGAVAVLSA